MVLPMCLEVLFYVLPYVIFNNHPISSVLLSLPF